jgi:hypothetical protein
MGSGPIIRLFSASFESVLRRIPAGLEWPEADAGYTRFRRVAETPFNIIYEARP